MSNTLYALVVATIAIATALLAVFDVVPATVAQMVPLLVVPFVISRGRRGCAGRAC
ncbi:hypothetical protein [Porphyrobacter sp. AAP82]|uniref:hypothetical protein n=1 Tax=Porphyrobacter sp. AAP82 TaxID=1248917 RepID=UPI0002EC4FFE|nr:hypothetical protein [Porphyrobacter sp. AAP82]